MRTLSRTTRSYCQAPQRARLAAVLFTGAVTVLATACASLPPVVAAGPEIRADSAPHRHPPPQCYGYVLLVENAHSQPVEIYEVGNFNTRFVAVALIGITEVPMTDRSQQFVAISRGVLMAASSTNEVRPSDRVALQRSCRLYQ